mgnify:FL=1
MIEKIFSKKRLQLLLGFALLVFFQPLSTFAQSTDSMAQEAVNQTGFYYEVIHPENQRSDAGYFDLRMTPGQEQQVAIKIVNTGAQPLVLNVHLNSAKTGSNGVVDYSPSSMKEDESLVRKFTDIVTTPEEVEIPGYGTKEIFLSISMPEEAYDGVIAGGIQLQVKDEESSEQSGAIVNKFAYLIGMLLTENDTEVLPEMTLRNVSAGHSNYRNSVLIEFANVEPTFVSKMGIGVEITKKGSQTVLYSDEKRDYRMAPNSLICVPVSMEGDAMKAGDYEAHIVVTSKEQRWEWVKGFTITREEAQRFNEEDVDLVEEQGVDWQVLLICLLGLVVVGLLMGLLFSRRKRKRLEQKQQNTPNKKQGAAKPKRRTTKN